VSPVTSRPPPLPSAPVELVAVTRAARGVLTRLGQLFRYDLSASYRLPPNPDGTFNDRQTDLFLAGEDGHRAWLVYAGGHLAGYTITRSTDGGGRGIAAFLVVAAFRRSGVGRAAAAQVLADAPGRWHIAFQDYNPGARPFWQHVATDAVGPAWRTYDDAPREGRPADSWITFDTSVGASGPAGGAPC
jgi:predicted acetyltransferase